MPKPNNINAKKTISGILIAAAYLWLAFILYKNHAALLEIFGGLTAGNILWLVLSTLLVFLAVSLLVPLFHIIVHQNCHLKLPMRFLAKLFFTGQIISYLPSRFLGTAYMVNETQKLIPAVAMVRINIELVAMIITYNVFASLAILTFYEAGTGNAVTVAALGIIFFAMYLRLNLLDKFLGLAARIAPAKLAEKLTAGRSKYDFSYGLIARIVGIMLLYWIFYILSWLCLKQTFPLLADTNVILLSATYTLSWIIGFITLITPGGLGIREVSFVALNARYMTQFHSSFLSIFLRVWLILIDISLYLISRTIVKIFPVTLDRE
ncbi:MAG: flippase-like domain-containing protein [Candidatus Omnitrophica bacterium]|nr:flippase-like domain-containing protein [Candidatus Omnitrophota bacterium]